MSYAQAVKYSTVSKDCSHLAKPSVCHNPSLNNGFESSTSVKPVDMSYVSGNGVVSSNFIKPDYYSFCRTVEPNVNNTVVGNAYCVESLLDENVNKPLHIQRNHAEYGDVNIPDEPPPMENPVEISREEIEILNLQKKKKVESICSIHTEYTQKNGKLYKCRYRNPRYNRIHMDIPIMIGDRNYAALVDTGATVSAVNKQVFDEFCSDSSVVHKVCQTSPIELVVSIGKIRSNTCEQAEIIISVEGKRLCGSFMWWRTCHSLSFWDLIGLRHTM